jgi:pimeloyl-ACP methyl ester carboxylesterase
MIVADMAPKAYPVHHKQIIEGLQAVASAKPGERQKADQILARHVSELSVRQFLLKNLIRTPEGFDWRINLPVIARDIAQVGAPTPSEKKVNKPALFIRGANSNYIQDEDIPLIKALFPNASVATVQGAGHWVHAEKPEETAQLVEDFLHGV